MAGASNERTSDPLLAGRSNVGQRVEMVREPDGSVAILFDGLHSLGCHWPADQTEDCVSVFLALLRANRLI